EQNIARHHALLERYTDIGGMTYKSRTKSALIGLGFLEEELDLPLAAVSGGQRTRALLAKLLLGGSEILLLDEPTNHLDISAIAWLEEFLVGYKGTVIIISHDRYFLDRVVGRIFDLENGHLTAYRGNYTQHLEKKAALKEAKRREYEQKTKEIARLEGIIAQQKQWNRERNLVTARSKQKAIDRIEETLEAPEREPDEIRFTFAPTAECGNDVLLAAGVAKAFDGKKLFSGADLHVRRGDRAFLLGDNGCGKTTLLRMVLGESAIDAGSITLGSNVMVGYYDQAQSDMDEDKTPLETLSDALPYLNLGVLRNALAAFLFRGDEVNKKIGTLSGGERARVALCRLMLSKANFLLLDEPTNHLDIPSKEVLEQALLDYTGTLLIVSHDRYFINKLATGIYHLGPDGMEHYVGDYQYYLEKAGSLRREPAAEKPQKENEYKKRKEEASRKNRAKGLVSRLEKRIEELEGEIAALQEQMSDPAVAADYQQVAALGEKSEELGQELEALYEEWEEASLLL
ncbi:MAG: ABC-F family ATP-binding cassette domain-containing protein, partial [Christensenellaceae bacterium]|nr:ABC-F family ATP-binding cassette domain-containing protein [Christensenellaceae bacterium]